MANAKYTLAFDWLLGRKVSQILDSDVRFSDLAIGIVFVLFFYGIALTVYRLYFSPLAGFPGPKLAAATEWYEFYYQLVRDGQWGNKVGKLHEKYGKTSHATT